MMQNDSPPPPPHHQPQTQQPQTQQTQEEDIPPLTSSSRLMGYFCLFLLSCLSFVAAFESDGIHKLSNFLSNHNTNHNNNNNDYDTNSTHPNKYLFHVVETVVPATSSGRYYALVVSGVSAISNFIIMMIHYLDYFVYHHCHCTNNNNTDNNNNNNNNDNTNHHNTTLRSLFKPSSLFELCILSFSCTWWIIGVAIITSIRGPAGDGKGQFNLYFSTWLSCMTSIHMVEEWLLNTKQQYSSIYQMIASWPNRGPGWIRIFVTTLANLLCILDLYHRHGEVVDVAPHIAAKYERIDVSQWSWLIFVCVISFTTALGFSIVELFRRSVISSSSIGEGGSTGIHNYDENDNDENDDVIDGTKGGCESQIEGILLAFLVIIWLPSVVIATTDDGVASDFGNTYFFTWGSTIVVIHTFITWLQDWRKSVHEASRQLHLEYDRNKEIANNRNDSQEIGGVSSRCGGVGVVDDDHNETGNNNVHFSIELQDFVGNSNVDSSANGNI